MFSSYILEGWLKGGRTPEVKTAPPRSRPHLIDHILGATITLVLLFARLFYYVEPKEHHRKTRLTKNEEMMIVLAKVMARSTADLRDTLLERWLELRRCFST